jgi:hypothetical protein
MKLGLDLIGDFAMKQVPFNSQLSSLRGRQLPELFVNHVVKIFFGQLEDSLSRYSGWQSHKLQVQFGMAYMFIRIPVRAEWREGRVRNLINVRCSSRQPDC